MADRKVASAHEHTLLFVLLSRSIGLPTRLVYSMQPVSFKPFDLVKTCVPIPRQEGMDKNGIDKNGVDTSPSVIHKLDERQSSSTEGKSQTEQKLAEPSSENVKRESPNEDNEKKALKRKCESTVDLPALDVKLPITPVRGQLRTCQSEPLFSGTARNSEVILIDDNSSDNLIHQTKSPRRSMRGFKIARRQCRQRVNYTELSLSEDSSGAEDAAAGKCRISEDLTPIKNGSSRISDIKQQHNSSKTSSTEDGDDWETSLRQTASASVVTSQEAVYQRSEIQRIKDSDPTLRPGCDWWAEVYLEKEQNWIYVNTVVPVVNQPDEAEMLATRPMSYVLALDNDNHVKDLTKKYAGHWLSCARKLRLSEEWWQQVLAPFQHSDSERDQLENKRIHEQLMRKSLPATITEYKNHPLYALKRHLLKFEAIYPANATVFGVIRGEPIYARDSVYLLHTKDRWLFEGRCVRNGELPYKKVQSRTTPSKQKKFNEEKSSEGRKVELYGTVADRRI